MNDVQVRTYHDPIEPTVTATDPWWCVVSPLISGVYTAYRSRDEAVEHSARMYMRYGAVVPVELSDGLP